MDQLLHEIKKEIKQMFQECIKHGYNQAKHEINNHFKHTEKRLYAFKQLQKNVITYERDIENLKAEKNSGKSKDIVLMKSSGVRLSDDEILEGKIITIQMKIDRDIKEIKELMRALHTIKKITNHEIIHYKYFEELSDTEIAEKLHMHERTVRRNRKQLINKLMIALYGADVI